MSFLVVICTQDNKADCDLAAWRRGSHAGPVEPLQQIRAGGYPLRQEASVRFVCLVVVNATSDISDLGYLEETKRLYGVIEIRLQDRDWLAGAGRGRYSIADLNVIPWIRIHAFAGIETLDEWPRLKVSI